MFSRILIANRGEIALRIIRACHELGVEAVVAYSEADAQAQYLAEIADVQAIHPGYGFLAENAHFAEVCAECGIAFIGPTPESMKLLGDKVAARDLARGSDGAIEDEAEAIKIANKIGYPIIIKAAAGGGGRGMRVVHNDITLRGALGAAKAEAEAAFKNGDLYVEKFISEPRHVEVQVVADKAGNALHFYESALKVVKEANYVNAGTVEFLLDKDNRFYFMEVNTRIQVEHPVTEMVTGHDLIKWQLKIASGRTIDLRQKDIRHTGVAIECRINAEDPANNFVPCPGTITKFIPPGGLGVRLDTHLHQGCTVSPHYDSMVGKLIVHKKTREEAITTMKQALREFKIEPVKTTIPACLQILSNSEYARGRIDTSFVERHIG